MQNIKLLKVGETLPVNEEMAGLVPLASMDEQAALTADIRANGLREPVVLWKGEIVDGRCRQIACGLAGKPLMAKDLDNELNANEVEIFVKSINTRRNLTATQKIIVACKESFKEGNKLSVVKLGESWGVSASLIKNARYIHKVRHSLIEPLFNGMSVDIVDKRGNEITTNKVSAIYAWAKRYEESMEGVGSMKEEYGYKENTQLKTQHAKDFYQDLVSNLNISETDIFLRVALVDYANLKHQIPSQDDPIVKDEEVVAKPVLDTPDAFMETLQTQYQKDLFRKKVDENKDTEFMRNMISKMTNI